MKFIRINPKIITLKPGGGIPRLEEPENIDNLKNLKDELKKIDYFAGEEVAHLTHKKINEDDFIPAASRRFVKSMLFLFSNNKKRYETTFFDEDKKELVFVYWVTFAEIEDIISKIEKTITFLEDNQKGSLSETLKSLFNDNEKEHWKYKARKFRDEQGLTIFSITGLREVLSSAFATYKRFWIPNRIANFSESDNRALTFVSSRSKAKSRDILIKNRVEILFEDDVSLDIEGSFVGKLPGLINYHSTKNLKPILKSADSTRLENAIYEKLRDENLHSQHVGVIDGGVGANSIIFRELSSYHSNEEMFNKANPKGTHAEEVTSVLLFAKNISKINDNLPRPRVHLFNVIRDDDKINQLKLKIEKIVDLYWQKIKIWNLSIVVPDWKNSPLISSLGVFLDKLQKEHGVIFVIPTGNIEDEYKSKTIDAPAGSNLALSISAVKSNFQVTSCSKRGYQEYVSAKPDLAIFGGDEGDEFPVVSNNMIKRTYGSSFAAPLATRKLSYLVSQGLGIREAVALLINYAHYVMCKKNIEPSEYNGYGVLPIDSSNLLDFKNNKAIITMDLSLKTDYKQGVLNIEVPKTSGNMFDFSYFIAINTDAVLEKNATFEYVLDSARIIFGKVYGNNVHNWKADDRQMDKEDDPDEGEEHLETSLRAYKGKYKMRDAFKKEISKIVKPTFTIGGQEHNIENWGIKITRNSLRAEGRKERMRTAISIIIESKSISNFFNQFIMQNKAIITSDVGFEISKGIKSDNVWFG